MKILLLSFFMSGVTYHSVPSWEVKSVNNNGGHSSRCCAGGEKLFCKNVFMEKSGFCPIFQMQCNTGFVSHISIVLLLWLTFGSDARQGCDPFIFD